MNTKKVVCDVAIVGAGIAGCHLAQLLQAKNIKVALIDKDDLNIAGPQWINAVPFWMFDKAGLEQPSGDEVHDLNEKFILRSPNGRSRLVIPNLGVPDVHMGLLGQRLKKLLFSTANTAQFIKASIHEIKLDEQGRVRTIFGTTGQPGTELSIEAKLFVDASGFKAVLRKLHPWQKTCWPNAKADDTCTAAQRVLAIKDKSGAKAYLESNNIEAGDVLADLGRNGGFSLFRAQIDRDFNHISLLCGIRAIPELPSAHMTINRFVKENSWIGEAYIDGRGVIPLNAPFPKLVAPGFALLGDAAHQVFAAHGSGIGFGLIAAFILAESIAESKDLGSFDELLNYQKVFHEKHYKKLFISEQFRIFSQGLEPEKIDRLFESDILSQQTAKETLQQTDISISLSTISNFFSKSFKSPRVFFEMLPFLYKAAAIPKHTH